MGWAEKSVASLTKIIVAAQICLSLDKVRQLPYIAPQSLRIQVFFLLASHDDFSIWPRTFFAL
jgi:hypothetical protein